MSGTGADFASIWPIGVTITASVVGLPFSVYRPGGNVGPALTAGNFVASTPVWLTGDSTLMAQKSNLYGKPVWYAAHNPTITQPGDYIVGPIVYGLSSVPLEVGNQQLEIDGQILYISSQNNSTFFIASQNVPAPIVIVNCNHVVSFTKDAPQPLAGKNPYGGRTLATDVPMLTGWPCSILAGTKGEQTRAALPADTRAAWYNILIPRTPIGLEFHMGDIMRDETGAQYIVSSTEYSALGWRLTAASADT